MEGCVETAKGSHKQQQVYHEQKEQWGKETGGRIHEVKWLPSYYICSRQDSSVVVVVFS